MSAADTFEYIIRHESPNELVPFLHQLPKADVVAVRQKTKSLKRELEAFKELKGGRWGSEITPNQRFMLLLAGLKTYSRKEAMGATFQIWRSSMSDNEYAIFWEMLDAARPDWLMDKMIAVSATKDWAKPEYLMLREMENRQLIEHHAALFAVSSAELLATLGNAMSKTGPVPADGAGALTQMLREDNVFLERDLPLIFDYDTAVDNTQAQVQLRMPADHGKWTWQTWSEVHPRQVVSWLDVLSRLIDSGAVSRADILTRSLLALRRDFRRPLLTWFKNLFVTLKPTVAERLERQQEIVELLAHPLPVVINFALDQLKLLWSEQAFNPSLLLVYADGLVTRQDIKTGLRTLLSGFEKLLKRDVALAPEIGRLSAAALASADTLGQEKGAKLLSRLLQPTNGMLDAAQAAEVTEAVSLYADLLAPAARSVLSPWLTGYSSTAGIDNEETARYQPAQLFTPDLSAANALAPARDWHELLFLTGHVLNHDDPTALERWVAGLLQLQTQFPDGYAGQLRPYLVQALPFLKGKNAAEADAIIAKHSQSGHFGLVQALLLSWAQGFIAQRVAKVNLTEAYYVSDPLVKLEQQRLAAAEEHLWLRTGLTLLSTPTHAPYWVAPSELVHRLLAYEALQCTPTPADLAVALARTAFTHEADAQAAQALLPRMQHEGLRELLSWFLAPSTEAVPVKDKEKKSLVRHLTERLGKLLPSTAVAPASISEALPWLWAVAARTKQPNGVFGQLEQLTGSDYPGIVRPWNPEWEFEVKTNSYVEQWKPGKPVVTHRFTQLTFPSTYTSKVAPSALLLYSQYVRFSGMNNAGFALAADYPFVAALLPNNPAPLHWHVLRSAGWADGLESTERDLISRALQSLLGAGPVFEEPTTRLLACGLTHRTPVCRALALEVLLGAINQHRLVAEALGSTLGQLLAVEFVPIQRLTDNLTQARAINAVTDDALRQVLGAVIMELPSEPLRNTRKLLETYADYAGRCQEPIPVLVKAKLQQWSGVSALKTALHSLM